MADVPETKAPNFELRDFLFYVVPGAVVLAAVVLSSGINREAVSSYSEAALAGVAVLSAYVLGHIAYGFTYPLRRVFGPRVTYADEDEEYKNAYMWMIERHTVFYATEVHRYNSLSQFTAAMVLPILLFGTVLVVRLWTHTRACSVLVAVITALAAVVFAARYIRYRNVVRDQVMRCWMFPWDSPRGRPDGLAGPPPRADAEDRVSQP